MLYESDQLEPLLARFAGDPVRGFTLRNFARPRPDGSGPARLLVDNLQDPHVVLALRGAGLCVAGELPALNPAFADLLAGRISGEWPGAELAADWDEHDGRRGFFFSASSLASWRAARIAGFVPGTAEFEGDNEFVAYQWTWQGVPHFAGEIRHRCRQVPPGNLELFDLIRQGVPYDREGHYVRQCLANGPSFVVETPGDGPVSWSCTHLNGFMGMLFTPEQHRRKGYARSLWAFQINAMLARDGIACCHVIDYNTPSMLLMQGLGGEMLPEPIVWRMLFWPETSQTDDKSSSEPEGK
jgi:hypothetical protein